MRFFISCGEPSGERYAAGIASHLQRLIPDVILDGLGGRRLETAGVRLVERNDDLAVVGLFEALSRFYRLWQVLGSIKNEFDRQHYDALVCVDFKEFNLRLASAAKQRGIPVVFFVGPQLWAWRPGRARSYAQVVDRLALLFPFEPGYYESSGLHAEFVGHPIVGVIEAEQSPKDMVLEAGLNPEQPLLLLQPGSRKEEITRLGIVMLDAYERLKQRVPLLQAVILAPLSVQHPFYDEAAHRNIPVVSENPYAWRKAATVALTASGTATLETALCGTPGAILYRLSLPTYWLAKWLVKIEHIGMPNILLGRRLLPELIQQEVTPANAAEAVLPWLLSPEQREQASNELLALRKQLGGDGDPLEKVAKIALECAGDAVINRP